MKTTFVPFFLITPVQTTFYTYRCDDQHIRMCWLIHPHALAYASVCLQPFFEIHDSRYMIYWLALSQDSYKEYINDLAKKEQERQALEERTTDKVQPGEQQPETDHKMETDQSNKGVNNDVPFRDARDGHYFSYLMNTDGNTNLSVRLKFWGHDEWKSCEFDIYVDDVLVKSVNNTHKWKTSQWKVEEYPIPAETLKGKSQVRVKFVANSRRQIGELYEVRLVK